MFSNRFLFMVWLILMEIYVDLNICTNNFKWMSYKCWNHTWTNTSKEWWYSKILSDPIKWIIKACKTGFFPAWCCTSFKKSLKAFNLIDSLQITQDIPFPFLSPMNFVSCFNYAQRINNDGSSYTGNSRCYKIWHISFNILMYISLN